jgi:hypothetical protein
MHATQDGCALLKKGKEAVQHQPSQLYDAGRVCGTDYDHLAPPPALVWHARARRARATCRSPRTRRLQMAVPRRARGSTSAAAVRRAAVASLALLLAGAALLALAPAAQRAATTRVAAALAARLSLAPPLPRDDIIDGDASSLPREASQGMRMWLNPGDTAELHLRVYLWEVLNPGEVLSGAAAPALAERGPWTYARALSRTPVPPPGASNSNRSSSGSSGNASSGVGARGSVSDDDGTMWCAHPPARASLCDAVFPFWSASHQSLRCAHSARISDPARARV